MKLQLSKEYNEKQIAKLIAEGSAMVSNKIDGVRIKLTYFRKNGVASCIIESRAGKPLRGLDLFAAHAAEVLTRLDFKSIILDGEATVLGESFQTACGMIRSNDPLDPARVIFSVFQCLEIDGEDLTSKTFEYRHAVASAWSPWLTLDHYIVHSMEEIEQAYILARQHGHEGLIIKDAKGLHLEGKKNGWYKLKPNEDIDGTVVGINQLWSDVEQTYKDMVGSLQVVCEDGTITAVSGLTHGQRVAYFDTPELIVGSVIRIKFMERTDDGGLRHPRFDGIRSLPCGSKF